MDTLKFPAYDFDDNLFCLETKILLLNKKTNKIEEFSTEDFVHARKDENYEITDFTFQNFRDTPNNEIFSQDFWYAVEHKQFGPSFEHFKKTIIEANIFTIITSRGHNPKTIKNVLLAFFFENFSYLEKKEFEKNFRKKHKLFNETDFPIIDYLNNCVISTITNPRMEFLFKDFNLEERKYICMETFVDSCLTKVSNVFPSVKTIKFGFSDDDLNYFQTIENFFAENEIFKKQRDFNVETKAFYTKF